MVTKVLFLRKTGDPKIGTHTTQHHQTTKHHKQANTKHQKKNAKQTNTPTRSQFLFAITNDFVLKKYKSLLNNNNTPDKNIACPYSGTGQLLHVLVEEPDNYFMSPFRGRTII